MQLPLQNPHPCLPQVDGNRHLLLLWLRGGGAGGAPPAASGPEEPQNPLGWQCTPSRWPRGLCGNVNGDPDGRLWTAPPKLHPPGTRPALLPSPGEVLRGARGPRGTLCRVSRGGATLHVPLDLWVPVVQEGGDPCPGFQGYAAACQAAAGLLWECRETTGCREYMEELGILGGFGYLR